MGGGGENGHVNPGSARHVFPSVLDSHPLLWALVLTVRHGGWARSWIGSPGERSVAVAAKTGGTQLPPDTSRSGPRQRAGAVVRRRKGREASAKRNQSWLGHPTISSSVVPFSSCLQSFPASGSFQMSQFFVSGGQSIVRHLMQRTDVKGLQSGN